MWSSSRQEAEVEETVQHKHLFYVFVQLKQSDTTWVTCGAAAAQSQAASSVSWPHAKLS